MPDPRLGSTVFEAHHDTAHGVGATMGLSTNGLAALQALDAHLPVRHAGFPVPRGVLWLGNGRRLGEDVREPLPDGTTAIQLLRSDLYGTLRELAAERGIRTVHGKRLARITHGRDHVMAHFADGSREAGDVLIGADGMHSVTRAEIDPKAPRPRYSGIFGTGGFARDIEVDAEPGDFHMVFGKKAFFGYTVRDDGCVWWFVNIPASKEPDPAAPAAVSDSEWHARLQALHARDASPASRIIGATPPAYQWFVSHQMAAPRVWSRGRAVLIGDACHVTSPSSGQGASMAIEDAVELARCLRDLPVEQAFAAYQRLREPRLRRIHAGAKQINWSKSATGFGRMIRDAMFPAMMRRFNRPEVLAWLHEHRIDFERPVTAD
ncbi:FAD-dependent monooxygenase [Nonomuraea sp. NN258]|uniref:FAD-dependent oxidoreductase n=1 Tax=Nonomuraea antri TaxID=2730852 RepID=UPI001568D926|nr:NAD(P)/FAD-dependent oxidoreductase [Nonomuraea antri]NRQ35274.1 FAD-dependent monooxygenase [Nonomuraea antri]